MIIVLKPSATEEQITKFTNMLKESYDVKVNKWDGVHSTVLGLIGDTTKIDIEYIDAQDIVENVKRVQEPYKKANRKFHPDNTVIKINDNVTIGDGSLHIMAGPCSVESEEQIVQIARMLKHRAQHFSEAAHSSLVLHHTLSRDSRQKDLTFSKQQEEKQVCRL